MKKCIICGNIIPERDEVCEDCIDFFDVEFTPEQIKQIVMVIVSLMQTQDYE